MIQATAAGPVLYVSVHPAARKDELREARADALKLSVTAAPEKGKANRAVIQLLARRLGLRRADLELIAGQTSSQKRVLVRGITADELRCRIERALAGPG